MTEGGALLLAENQSEEWRQNGDYAPLPLPTGREAVFRTTAKLAAAEEQGPPRSWEVIVWKGVSSTGALIFGVLVRPADMDLVLNRVDTTTCGSLKVDAESKLLSVASPHYGQLSLYLNDEVDAQVVGEAVTTLQKMHEYREARENVLLEMHTIGQQRQLLANDELSESSEGEGYMSGSEPESLMDNNTDAASSSCAAGETQPPSAASAAATASAAVAEAEPVVEEQPMVPVAYPLVDACIYCGGYDQLSPHPYVPHNFNGQKVWFCATCRENWTTYRETAKKAGELMLPGEPNEEICAICSAVPSTLVMCNDCPRSFCSDCLDRLLTVDQKEAMQRDDIWRCFLCVKKRRKHQRNSSKSATGETTDAPEEDTSQTDTHGTETNERKRKPVVRWTEEHLMAVGEAYNRFGQHGLHKIFDDPELHARSGHRSVESITVKWHRMSDTEKNRYLQATHR